MDGECDSCCGCFNFEDKEFSVKRGDYAPLMEKVSHYLQKAQVKSLLVKRLGSLFVFVFHQHNRKVIAKSCDAAGQLAFGSE